MEVSSRCVQNVNPHIRMFIVNTDRTDIQCIIAFFIMRLLARLYVRVHILHTSGRYFHDRIIYLRDEGPVLVVEEAGVAEENHRPWASNW
jgi:hypothetical protein